ncbi:MAG: hypothetical protein IJX64_06340 [Clostridia bacterium]|nr:hypothetical protein [Clostridia bacterium]
MNTAKKDNLDALILLSAHVLAEQNCKEFSMTDTSDVVRPRSLDRRIERMIRREEQRRAQGFFFAAKRVAATLLIVCTVTAVAAMSVKSVCNLFFKTSIEQREEYISIRLVTDTDAAEIVKIQYRPTDISRSTQ